MRSALADCLERADRRELALAVHSHDVGPDLLKATAALAKRAALPLSVEILWAAHVLFPRLAERCDPIRPVSPIAVPRVEDEEEIARLQRPWRVPRRVDDDVRWLHATPPLVDYLNPVRWGLK